MGRSDPITLLKLSHRDLMFGAIKKTQSLSRHSRSSSWRQASFRPEHRRQQTHRRFSQREPGRMVVRRQSHGVLASPLSRNSQNKLIFCIPYSKVHATNPTASLNSVLRRSELPESITALRLRCSFGLRFPLAGRTHWRVPPPESPACPTILTAPKFAHTGSGSGVFGASRFPR